MKKSRIFLISLCFFILFGNLAEAQSVRLFKRNHKNPEDFWKPNENGCRVSYVSTLGNAKPSDLYGFVRWTYRNLLGKNGGVRVHYDCQPVIKDVILSQTEIIKDCSKSNFSRSSQIPSNSHLIDVSTKAFDIEGDPLLYNYKVSGGNIIANGENKGSDAYVVENGANVVWDLSEVPPGVYTITVGVDDGCGVCTEPLVKSIKITDCK